ncbi:hypothetical protein [Bartonella sp. B1098]|nr:hypothetical protein [Bartonella sp. B1098]
MRCVCFGAGEAFVMGWRGLEGEEEAFVNGGTRCDEEGGVWMR